MFLLNGKPLALDVPFEANGTLYPANWLRLASPAERAAIGITEQPDPPSYDQRFYWGYTASGTLIPKDHTQLVSQWTDTTRHTANTLLTPTDWMVVKAVETGGTVAPDWNTWRQTIRTQAADAVAVIEACTTVDQLAALPSVPRAFPLPTCRWCRTGW